MRNAPTSNTPRLALLVLAAAAAWQFAPKNAVAVDPTVGAASAAAIPPVVPAAAAVATPPVVPPAAAVATPPPALATVWPSALIAALREYDPPGRTPSVRKVGWA